MDALVIYGVSGSGKSTFAEEFNSDEFTTLNLERDNIRKRFIPNFSFEGWKGHSFNSGWEEIVTYEWHKDLSYGAEKGLDLIISDTLCKVGDRRKLGFLLKHLGYDVLYYRITTSLEECIERDSKRGIWEVGEDVIRRQWDNLNKHSGHI